jgi:succinate-semialdehyde dehydrogenase / glutarate-semialdehyde dehydrogenase
MNLMGPNLLQNQCYIDGVWVGEATDIIRNPATREEVGAVPHLGAEHAAQAVEAASRAFPGWSRQLAKIRSAVLEAWNKLILAHREDLARLMTMEQGKPLAEARTEIDYAASFVSFYAEEARRLYGEIIPTHRLDARIMVTRQPIGVVAAITPWNFPAAMITRKIAPALAAGCTVVIKPAQETPLTALALVKLAEQAGFPKGVINIVTGDAPAIGEVFTSHEAVRFVSFTGSTEVGRLLMRQSSTTLKKLGLELGGNAAFIVFDDADLEAATDGAIASKFRNSGQTCVCANRFYVQEGIYEAFLAKLTDKVKALKLGNGLDEGITQGPLINEKAATKVEAHIADAVAKGAKLVTGGQRAAQGGTFFKPSILRDVNSTMLIASEETFGPVAALFPFTDEADVIAKANATPYGLAAYCYARDIGRIFRMAEALECGMVGINAAQLGVDTAPFGGVKQSGQGREGSHHGIEEFTELKYILLAGLDQ